MEQREVSIASCSFLCFCFLFVLGGCFLWLFFGRGRDWRSNLSTWNEVKSFILLGNTVKLICRELETEISNNFRT